MAKAFLPKVKFRICFWFLIFTNSYEILCEKMLIKEAGQLPRATRDLYGALHLAWKLEAGAGNDVRDELTTFHLEYQL